jgi:lipopolysaccharide export system permease protein
MTILSRYIFRQAAGAVLMILVSLTVVIWVAVALRQLEFMASQGQTFGLFFKLTTLALPSLIAFIAPVAMLIAMVHTLNRLNGDSELIIATAGGASTWRLAWPLLTLAVIVSVLVSASNHFVAPWSNRLLRDTAMQARSDLIGQILQPGRFSSAEPKLTVHIKGRADDGTLLGLLVHDARDEKQATSYLAERGTIVKQGQSVYLLMQNGHILRKQAVDAPADVVVFQRYAVDINRFEQKTDSGFVIRPRERITQELLNPDVNDPIWRDQPGRYRSELHSRMANGLYPFAFALLALAFVGQAQTTRQNRTLSVVLAIAVGFGALMLGISAANQAVVKPSAVAFLYAVPSSVGLMAAAAIMWNMRPRAAWRRPAFGARRKTKPKPMAA